MNIKLYVLLILMNIKRATRYVTRYALFNVKTYNNYLREYLK